MSNNKSKKSKSGIGSSPKSTRKLSPRTPPIPVSPPPMSLSHTLIPHTIVTSCPVPYLYLDPIDDSIFQVSFTDIDNILFKNTTKKSKLDCGYKALEALGLRNKYINAINSRMVNSRGTIGILFEDMSAYIEYIYDLPEDTVEYKMRISQYMPINQSTIIYNLTNFVMDLEESHATIIVVYMCTKPTLPGPHKKLGHYMVAYKYQGIVYYYNPQTNTPSSLISRSISNNLILLLDDLYPNMIIENWGGFMIRTQGHPKPLIKNRLKSFLKFVGGGRRGLWVNHNL
jgi:hypothetical protein